MADEQPQNIPTTPLLIYKPISLELLLIFYSPLVVALIILSMSFIFQNFKGITYIICLIIFVSIRSFFMEINKYNPYVTDNKICTMVKFSNFGNSGFSIFFIAYSFVYICGPMIWHKQVNYWLLCVFLFYLFLDIGTRYNMGCIKEGAICVDLLLGVTAGIVTLWIMSMAKLWNYLFFNETSSTKDMCSMPSKQTFKCAVYKGGQLVGSTTT
jgi:hypothetical protein